MRSVLKLLVPEASTISFTKRLRFGFCATFGTLATGSLQAAALGSGSGVPALIPPMGASAILLFAVPSSPLAQPWPVIGGNLIAALTGVSVGMLFANLVVVTSISIGVAIVLMMAFRNVNFQQSHRSTC
jgi:CBS domain-containing membrane protein